ncbi:MAG: glycosyltransferase family 87 protein [Candidatus Binatia bacterium]
MTFYVAGHLVANGRYDQLYPSPNARSFIDSPFDKAAHRLLPHLPRTTTGAYMYTPLVAGFFVPFRLLDPNTALLVWQVFSILALLASAFLLAQITRAKASDIFFLSFLFAPVFLTLWAGQLGLAFGLLPLCLGYVLMLREKPLFAGLVWSLLLFKPQFFLPAAFVAVICACRQRFRPLIAMILGGVALLFVTVDVFSWPVTLQWITSHRVSDVYFFSGLQGIPSHLLTGLPANLMLLFTVPARETVKLPLYIAAAAAWLYGVWFCLGLKRPQTTAPCQISIALTVGVILASLTLPHLLYYDLCVLLPAGVLLLAKNSPISISGGSSVGIIGWIAITSFFPLLLGFAYTTALPLMLELIILFLFIILLIRLREQAHAQNTLNGESLT